jgi:hypothetical protein
MILIVITPRNTTPFQKTDESRLADQEILRLSWDLTISYQIHKNTPLDSILHQIQPVHTLRSNVFNLCLINERLVSQLVFSLHVFRKCLPFF